MREPADLRAVLGLDATPLFVIAGPCVAESWDVCAGVADRMRRACDDAGVTYIFKASYDKANRSSGSSYRGPGIDAGLRLLERAGETFGVPTLTDVHEPAQAAAAGEVATILQVPAFLARQTSLLAACGRTNRIVNIKKGQFMAPGEMATAADKVRATGNDRVVLTERGTFFGYGRLVNDFGGLRVLGRFGCPVVFDATHSTQTPGTESGTSGGDPTLAPVLARAAVAAGVDGVFIECHPEPAEALSDRASMMRLDDVPRLVAQLAELSRLRANWSD